MKPFYAALAAVLAFAFCISCADAQSPASTAIATGAEVSFGFERSGLPVPKYTLTVHEDGTGTYQGEELTASGLRTVSSQFQPSPASSKPQEAGPSEPFLQSFTLSSATSHRIFALARTLKQFNLACASKAKNIADTGTKTLTYRSPAGGGSCTYNYSENKNVVQLTDLFYGLTETMDTGRRLDHLHRYDRLGLDSAIGLLAQQVTDGRALELGSIAETLRSIASDADLMQRVRVRASQLLSLLPAEMQTSRH
ncbi:MAG: hypothetical protein NVSMB62_02170 [Acidobacteriaceae bacterium]